MTGPIERRVKIVNLTDHPLELGNGWTFARFDPDGRRVRVDSDMMMTERVDITGDQGLFVPILDVTEQEVIGLPDPEPRVLYVVSGIVASNVRGRKDVVSPGRVERDQDGHVKRAKALVRINQLKER